ncbi:hypothetical protein J21TS3_51490 [Paenibacillus cookii]|jgi:hypothetical protein|uniref:Uncharacterized protein n=1 Tax=Paenibacillus cookii TaxID=157839 RepID=A0ABQ4M4H2_9BACL|nr:hypothetical protein J21TS3_51490 [Paenibacillus cookii]
MSRCGSAVVTGGDYDCGQGMVNVGSLLGLGISYSHVGMKKHILNGDTAFFQINLPKN